MKPTGMWASLLLGLAGCATAPVQDSDNAPLAGAAAAELRDSAGRSLGSASVTQTSAGLRVRIVSTGMPAGVHGAHLHGAGSCQAPDFATAGPHWNPTSHLHGRENPQGPHLGDMPNLLVGTDGQGTLEFSIADAQLDRGDRRLLDADGASLVIHASADDYRTDPSGNSGARIACGVLQPVIVR